MNTKQLLMITGIMLLSALVTGYHGSVSWTNAILISSLLAFLIKFGLALWIYMLNPSANVNRTFAIVFTGQAVWDLGKFVMWLTNDASHALIWAKISYSGYIISVFFLLSFVWAYLKKKNYFTTVQGRIVLYTPMVFMLAALWAGNGVISGLIPPDALHFGFGIELWDYTYGPVYSYFFMWFQIIPFIYAFILFVFKYFHTQAEDKKKQIFYLMLGSAFPIMLGIPTGVLLPAMGTYLPPHNNVLSLIMSVFIAVGIIKYKFLSIQPIGERIVPGRKLEHELAKRYRMEPGHSYFIKHEKSSEIAYGVLLTHLYQRKYGLIITAHNPAKIRHEHGIETTPVIWMTDTETEHLSVDPIDIEQIHETIKKFIEKVPNAFVLIDGIDYLLMHNNFAKILHFIKQVKGMMTKSDDCLIVPKGSLVLDPKQQKLLEAEFLVLPKAAAEAKEAEKTARGMKRNNYIILGHNPLAQSIISEFEKRSIKPVVVEKQDVLVHYPKGVVDIVKGDPLSSKVLIHAGICKPNTVVLVTLEDDSDIILCINKIRQISDCAKIITNINNQNFISIALKAGADNVIPSSSIGGRLISLALSSPDIVRWVMDATTLAATDLELCEFVVDTKSRIVGKTVEQVDRHMGKSANIIAVKTVEGLRQIPDDDYVLKEGDRLVLIVNMEALPKGKEMAERVGKLVKQKY
jgi:voltage-gated potassium channel